MRRDKNGNTWWLIIFKLIKAMVKGRVLQTDDSDSESDNRDSDEVKE